VLLAQPGQADALGLVGGLRFAPQHGRQLGVEGDAALGVAHPLRGRMRPAWALRAQLVPLAEGVESGGELPLLLEHEAQGAVRLGVVGVEGDGPAVLLDRLPQPVLSL
jgi:hypothetical protein